MPFAVRRFATWAELLIAPISGNHYFPAGPFNDVVMHQDAGPAGHGRGARVEAVRAAIGRSSKWLAMAAARLPDTQASQERSLAGSTEVWSRLRASPQSFQPACSARNRRQRFPTVLPIAGWFGPASWLGRSLGKACWGCWIQRA